MISLLILKHIVEIFSSLNSKPSYPVVGWINKLDITYNKPAQGFLSAGIEITDMILAYKIKQGEDFSEELKYR